MKSARIILALGILALSSSAYAADFDFSQHRHNCEGGISFFGFFQSTTKSCGSTVSVPEPATLGLRGIGLIGLAVKRRKK